MSNIPGGMMRFDNDTSSWIMRLPIPADAPMPLLSAEHDTGKYVVGILNHPSKTLGQRILGSPAYYTPSEIVSTFQKVKPEAGKGAKFVQISEEDYKKPLIARGMSELATQDLYENMILMARQGYYGGQKLDPNPDILSEKLTTWEEYVSLAQPWKDLK